MWPIRTYCLLEESQWEIKLFLSAHDWVLSLDVHRFQKNWIKLIPSCPVWPMLSLFTINCKPITWLQDFNHDCAKSHILINFESWIELIRANWNVPQRMQKLYCSVTQKQYETSNDYLVLLSFGQAFLWQSSTGIWPCIINVKFTRQIECKWKGSECCCIFLYFE